jgi:hypothetical protein
MSRDAAISVERVVTVREQELCLVEMREGERVA